MCLKANKHVLLEKPFALNATDAEYLIKLAREKNLFLLEGMWTRFFPAVEQARRLVCGIQGEKGVLGEVVSVSSDFNFNAADTGDAYPGSFFYNHGLGGGATYLAGEFSSLSVIVTALRPSFFSYILVFIHLFHAGPYPMAASILFFNGAKPDECKAVGQVDRTSGVDLQACVALSFPPTSDVIPALDETNPDENTAKLPGCGVASLSYGMLGESVEETTVIGTKGRLVIRTPGHCPTSLKVAYKEEGRLNVKEVVYDYPLPEDTEEITKTGGFVYPNSAGFCYEAAAVARFIAAGKTEAPQYTLNDTLICIQMIDDVRKQLGVKPVPNP